MALVFPSSPTPGQTYVGPNNITYTWDNTLGVWTGSSPAAGGLTAASLAQAAAGTLNTVASTPQTAVPKDTSGMAGAALLPSGGNYAGTTTGMLRFNTTSNHVEFYDGTAWRTSVNRSGDTMTGPLVVNTASPGIVTIGTGAFSTTTSVNVSNGAGINGEFNASNVAASLLLQDTAISAGVTVNISSDGYAQFFNRSSPATSSVTINSNNAFSQTVGMAVAGYPYQAGSGVQASTAVQVKDAAGTNISSIGPTTFLMTTPAGGGMMYLDGSQNVAFTTDAGGNKYWILQTNGDGICTGGTWISSSDAREKTDVESLITEATPATEYTNKIKKLRPVTFHRLGREDEDLEMGFIAQEVQEELPLLIPSFVQANSLPQDEDEEDKSEDRLAMNYNGLTAPMVAAMQEMIARIESLEAELAALKGA